MHMYRNSRMVRIMDLCLIIEYKGKTVFAFQHWFRLHSMNKELKFIFIIYASPISFTIQLTHCGPQMYWLV